MTFMDIFAHRIILRRKQQGIKPEGIKLGKIMIEMGAFAAKTHLSAILDKVCAGEEILITKRGRAVARLVPAEQPGRFNASISKLLKLRGQVNLQGEDWKTLRDKGRR